MKKIVFSLGLSLTVLAGCSTTPQSEVNSHNSKLLTVEFIGNGSYRVPQQQGTVSLYALETRMADAPATLIQQKKVEVSQVPFLVDFKIPADHKKLIQPQLKQGAEITYYVTWKSDATTQTVKDSIKIDYDRKFPRVALDSGKQQVYLIESK